MKSIFRLIKKNFELSQHETYSVVFGLFGLFLMLGMAIAFEYWTDQRQSTVMLKPYAAPERTYQKLKKGQSDRIKWKYNKTKSREFQLFDPNKASLAELVENHFPGFLAKRLIRFRESGKHFRYKEELATVYGLDEAFYLELEPFIDLPEKSEITPSDEYTKSPPKRPEIKKNSFFPKKKEIAKFDINLATPEELEQVYGIGDYFSNRIIKFRDALGGFHSLEQISKTYGLPDSTYQEVLKYVFLKAPHRKVAINKVSLGDWESPILKGYQRKAILRYRQQHGTYESLDDLRKIKVLKPEDIEAIAPYLDFSKE